LAFNDEEETGATYLSVEVEVKFALTWSDHYQRPGKVLLLV
jgi:hypothetical protein